jgi:hypothetical protein
MFGQAFRRILDRRIDNRVQGPPFWRRVGVLPGIRHEKMGNTSIDSTGRIPPGCHWIGRLSRVY